MLAGYLALPRALVSEVTRCLSEHGIRLELGDRREDAQPLPVEFQSRLTEDSIPESHHLPAFSFERVLAAAKARSLVGLTV